MYIMIRTTLHYTTELSNLHYIYIHTLENKAYIDGTHEYTESKAKLSKAKLKMLQKRIVIELSTYRAIDSYN